MVGTQAIYPNRKVKEETCVEKEGRGKSDEWAPLQPERTVAYPKKKNEIAQGR